MAGFYSGVANVFSMSDAVWLRHTNPMSGWSRAITGLPLIALAIWSRDWIGWWSLAMLGIVAIWLWFNPRLFAVPKRFDAWISRGVLGEYVFIKHSDQVAQHHKRAANVLSWLTLPGVIALVFGLWRLDVTLTILGCVLTAMPKFWFLDRMVWLYADFVRAGGSVLGLEAEKDTL